MPRARCGFGSPGKAFTPRPGILPEDGFGSPDRRVKRRLRESVQGFRSLLSRRKCLTVVGERVKGEKTVSPFTIPAVPQRNRCCAPRSPPGPQPAVGPTRRYSSHLWDSPLRGQRKIAPGNFVLSRFASGRHPWRPALVFGPPVRRFQRGPGHRCISRRFRDISAAASKSPRVAA